jgi:hypothetical protein
VSTLIAALMLSGGTVAQETGRLNGTLTEPQGAAISNSLIQLRWNSRGDDSGGVTTGKPRRPGKPWRPHKTSLQVRTDSAGRFSIALPAGNWDVFAYRDLFAPDCGIVLIEAGKTTNIALRFPRFAAMAVH